MVMEHVLSLAFAISAICAGLMGFAIQRGATCTVAAVDEWITKRRATRLASMLEASLWVVAGLTIARMFGVARSMPAGYPVGLLTVAGGALLGFGAYVNRACVFGAIARLGSGEWAYVFTPLGFYIGCVTVNPIFSPMTPTPVALPSLLLSGPTWIGLMLVGLLMFRVTRPVLAGRLNVAVLDHLRTLLGHHIWSPRAATSVIGVTFVIILLLSGAWAYTDVLAELASHMADSVPARCGLFIALLAGAVIGGATAGRLKSIRMTASQIARCFAGGVLMGWGSLLIPGSNDGLILIGLPLLRPYAWIAFGTMCVVIGLSMLVARRIAITTSGVTVRQ
jgi:toxin CptA